MKEQLFDELINSMANCKKCVSLKKKIFHLFGLTGLTD